MAQILASLRLQNFQSHSNSRIEFSPRVTAITGHNNNGKSAVVRALKKVIRDTPDGSTFVRDGADLARITAVFVDGASSERFEIVREVPSSTSKEENKYIIIDPQQDVQEFVKFSRSGIPAEVISKMGFDVPVEIAGEMIDLNIQMQLDELFLVQGTGLPSFRGKVISKITEIDVVNNAIQEISLEQKRLSSSCKSYQQQLDELAPELKKYEHFAEITRVHSVISGFVAQLGDEVELYEAISSHLPKITALVEKATKLNEAYRQLRDVDPLERRIEQVESDVRLLQEHLLPLFRMQRRLEELENVEFSLPSLEDLDKEVDTLLQLEQLNGIYQRDRARLRELQQAEFNLPVITIDDSVNLLVQLKDLSETIKDLSNKQQVMETSIEIAQKELSGSQQELEMFEKQLGVCPVCRRAF
jgi:exonuclease SbcC